MKPANTSDKLKAVVDALKADKEKKSTPITNGTPQTNNNTGNTTKK